MFHRYSVRSVTRDECAHHVLNVHYAGRWPSISYHFGLFRDNLLVGVATYGTPSSPTLRVGVAGEQYKNDVIELNRLVLTDNLINEASFLVGGSIKLLPKGKIIVSYADISQGHIGYVYQATNFLYCGLSAKRTDWAIKGKEHLHGTTIADEFRGVPNRSVLMREKYGDDFYLKPRPRKHRYVYINGSKSFKRVVLRNLKYKIENYPKREVDDV